MISFLEEIEQSLPIGLVLPEEFRCLFVWMEAGGFVHRYEQTGERYASLYPANLRAGKRGSLVSFEAVKPSTPWFESWTRERLALFIRTGGDYSQAGLWRSDEGRQVFVHFGSGSGSTMVCTLTDNPIDLLRLLAIGYQELCWPEWFAAPPEAFVEEDEEDYLPPTQFREWVETSFGVAIPMTASEIVPHPVDMHDDVSDDPFWCWVRKHYG